MAIDIYPFLQEQQKKGDAPIQDLLLHEKLTIHHSNLQSRAPIHTEQKKKLNHAQIPKHLKLAKKKSSSWRTRYALFHFRDLPSLKPQKTHDCDLQHHGHTNEKQPDLLPEIDSAPWGPPNSTVAIRSSAVMMRIALPAELRRRRSRRRLAAAAAVRFSVGFR